MKTIHAVFTDEEKKKLSKIKKELKLNWHDFIMLLKDKKNGK